MDAKDAKNFGERPRPQIISLGRDMELTVTEVELGGKQMTSVCNTGKNEINLPGDTVIEPNSCKFLEKGNNFVEKIQRKAADY